MKNHMLCNIISDENVQNFSEEQILANTVEFEREQRLEFTKLA